jgi:hypothetical protein
VKPALLSALAALGACGASSPAGPKNQPAVFVQSDTLDESTRAPANFACLHRPSSEPLMQPGGTIPLTVEDFEKSTPVAGAVVEAYFGAVSGTPQASSAPTGADGKTSIVLPAGPYRVVFRTTADPQTTVETIEYNRVYNDGRRYSVSLATKSAIPAIVGVVTDDARGTVAGSLRDCDEKEVGGVTVEVSQPPGFDGRMTTFYFVDPSRDVTVPSLDQKWTSGNGVFATLNAPAGNVLVEAYGYLVAGGPRTLLGEMTVPVRAGSITVAQVEPDHFIP